MRTLATGLVVLGLVACGGTSSDTQEVATPAELTHNLATQPITRWDSLMVDVAKAIARGDAISMGELRTQLMDFPEESGKGDPSSGHDAFPGPSRAVRLYLLGELAAGLGDSLGIQAAMDSLMSPLLIGGDLPRKPGSYALTLQALILEYGGQHKRALASLDSVVARIDPALYSSLWAGATLERPRLLAWLRAQGDSLRADSLRRIISSWSADSLVRWSRN